jgi:hypothetical protein
MRIRDTIVYKQDNGGYVNKCYDATKASSLHKTQTEVIEAKGTHTTLQVPHRCRCLQ